ncbi:MAG: AAA family ATPase [Polaromonas sp.]|nr:AAA family ATPase [Polaromonas sp.]
MKIAIISPDESHLQEMGRLLELNHHSVVLASGGKTKLRSMAEQDAPDLMLVDGLCCDLADLALVDYVTTHHPSTAVILLCPTQTPEFLIHSMRVGVREVLPSPATPEALEAAVNRVAAKLQGSSQRQSGQLLAFLACKGGSGTTFIATNLGYHLAESRSVLLIDLNLQFGDALSFVSEGPPTLTIADVARDINRLDASFLAATAVKVAPNYSVLAAPEALTQAMAIKPEHIDAIIKLALLHYDFVLLDLPRILDTLALKALDRADRIYPVLQASVPAIQNAKKLLTVFRSLGYPEAKSEIIVNRFEKGGDIGFSEIEQSLPGAILRTVPNSYKEVNAAINQGRALLESSRSNAVSKSLAELAATLIPPTEDARGFLGRIFNSKG